MSSLLLEPAKFRPTLIPNLVEWFDSLPSTFNSGTPTDGVAIDNWNGRLGKYNLTQSVAANKPTYKTNIINGYPVARFAGDFLDGTNAFLAELTTTYTMFFVTKAVVGQDFAPISAYPDDLNNRFLTIFPRDFDSSYYLDHGNVLSSQRLVAAASDIATQFYALTAYSKKSTNTLTIYRNNTQLGTNNASGTFTLGAKTAEIGGVAGTGSNGDVAEMIFYSRALSTDEITAVNSYLIRKYAL